jgi:hypothetical protein
MLLHTQDGVPVNPSNPEPVALYGPNGSPLFANPRLAADGLALPTAPDVLATLLGYDGANLRLLRTLAPSDSAPATGYLHIVNGVIQNGGTYGRLWSANTSGDTGNGANYLPAAAFDFNEGSWDRRRGNTQGTLLASAARTAQTDTADQTNHSARSLLLLFLRVTAASGTGGLQVVVRGKAPEGSYYALNNTPAAVTAVGAYLYVVSVGAPGATGAVTQATGGLMVPRSWAVRVLVGDASNYTYQLDYALL